MRTAADHSFINTGLYLNPEDKLVKRLLEILPVESVWSVLEASQMSHYLCGTI
jgi:hypothetical protein